jgi:hypothetical protein
LAPVKLGDKFGYVDRTGRIAISPQFLAAYPFSEGLAWVDLGDRMGAIDRSGKVVLRATPGLPGQFQGGLAHFQDTWSGYLDRSGKVIWQDSDSIE